MSEKKTSKDLINPKIVKELATILNETSLAEIEYEVEGGRIKVSRHSKVMASEAPVVFHEISPASVSGSSKEDSVKVSHSHHGLLKSPIVGTVYLSPHPGAEPFVKVGSQVEEGSTLLIIEAMKVMNPIKATRSGIVRDILVSNGEPVEYDHGLMVIE